MNPDHPGAADHAAPSDAPDTVPDQLRELPPDLPPEAPPAAAELSPADVLTKAPELSPAACGARLAELFPALFIAPGAPGPAKPIKLRIHADIQARAPGVFSKRTLGIFFSRYTTTNAYLKALASAPHRFDLDGQAAGEISDEHRGMAAEELARRHTIAAERRAAQRPPARQEAPAAQGDARARPDARPERGPGPRPDAGPRPQHPPAAPQRPQGGGQRPGSEHDPGAMPAPRHARAARPARHADRPLHAERRPHTDRPLHADRPPRAAPRPDPAPPVERTLAAAALPIDPAQRERALLLRSFESSPLSKANFCALKRISPADLDAVLAQAQAERGKPGGASSAAPERGRSAR